jgi:hypothetical protein
MDSMKTVALLANQFQGQDQIPEQIGQMAIGGTEGPMHPLTGQSRFRRSALECDPDPPMVLPEGLQLLEGLEVATG